MLCFNTLKKLQISLTLKLTSKIKRKYRLSIISLLIHLQVLWMRT